jgi:2-C-methyl-D-erythritol 4-phosphate cytidylyltransferase
MEESFSFTRCAILLMGGSGERFHSLTPKQFLRMGGHPLFSYAARVLENSQDIDFIVYVVPQGLIETAEGLIAEEKLIKDHGIIEGGATRSESAREALRYLIKRGAKPSSIVLLHDGDRPSLTARLIHDNIAAASSFGASVTALQSDDSVAICKEPSLIDGYLPRQEVYLLQTPQAFRLSDLKEAFEKAKDRAKNYTDEGSLTLSLIGLAPHVVLGDKNNLKITEPSDAAAFEKGLKK